MSKYGLYVSQVKLFRSLALAKQKKNFWKFLELDWPWYRLTGRVTGVPGLKVHSV